MAAFSQETGKPVRVVALVGPAGTGKTSLAEAMLFTAGAISRQGSVDAGTAVGDASPEARARRGSTELNLARFVYLEETFVLMDAPGASGFAPDALPAIAAADLAVVVIDPDPARAALAEPALRLLEALGVPHAIFVNKIDQARGRIRDLLEALQPMSARPILARQIPIREGEAITGFIDLALERAFHYRPGKASERIEIPQALAQRESAERFHMLEQLADHDDALLEKLLMDETPEPAMVFGDLSRETGDSLVVPLLFGSAQGDHGVRRLLKMLRHETPSPAAAEARLGADGGTYVFKIAHANAAGRLAYARTFSGLAEGAELHDREGNAVRAGALFTVLGDKLGKTASVPPGAVTAIAKVDTIRAGDVISNGRARCAGFAPPMPGHALAIATRDRKDDVRLSTALHKLVEEDAGLAWDQDAETHEMLLRGISDEHLNMVLARLKRRYSVAVDAQPPRIAYRESIRRTATQRGRHKKQSGGHGQFGDVVIEVAPRGRGEGFAFDDRITGGAVPRQWIPAVEAGVRDAMERGPLGFPVVDVAVTLIDGSYHTVDSSELAFRTAGRIAMSEALAACSPHLLEPVARVTIETPGSATSRITSSIASHRGQMLGITPRAGWSRWDVVEALMPEAQLHGLGAELRALSQGLATYRAEFDHLAELNGALADAVVKQSKAA
ncbi:elongation factor G [Sphingosinicella soli]|uniref:Elongation factor G n=1 Tax=Sphingosinicella soli TaxID=333708 RepID=A0A7W7AY91_9SPHN|nr:elongation factor G [Sphingosinicella soli]MBB4630598.1 elongation factor G [Sphingosinicella soli]